MSDLLSTLLKAAGFERWRRRAGRWAITAQHGNLCYGFSTEHSAVPWLLGTSAEARRAFYSSPPSRTRKRKWQKLGICARHGVTAAQVREIRRVFAIGRHSAHELVRRHGLSVAAIREILAPPR